MVRNYLKIAFRNIISHKLYSLINILGLATGLACFILIWLWVQNEISFDRFYKNADQIYRVIFEYEQEGKSLNHWRTPPPLSKALRESYPEIVNSTRFHSQERILVTRDNSKFWQTAGFTDGNTFDIFDFTFVKGDPETAFKNPYSVVITEQMVQKYFINENPINKTITIENQVDFTVTGVIEDLPENSYLKFDFVTQFDHLEEITGFGNIENWSDFGYNTFLLLPDNIQIKDFNTKIGNFLKTISPDFDYILEIQPLTHIHLYGLNGKGIITSIYILSSIAIFVLIIACINFMNLATARSLKRSKEVGMRKVLGAYKINLIQQFYGESILISLIALFFAVLFVELFLPIFNELAGKSLSFNVFTNLTLLPVLIIVALFTGFVAGSYPALFLSSFKPMSVLKNDIKLNSSGLRKALVVIQFALSIILIISTLVVSDQLKFLNRQKLGFDKENVVYIPLNSSIMEQLDPLKNELLKNPDILKVSAMSNKTGISRMWATTVSKWEGNTDQKKVSVNLIYTDYDFPETFNIQMEKGRFYSKDFFNDQANVVLNESAVKAMGLQEPIGKTIGEEKGIIIGVIKDFNFSSLHSPIEPLALVIDPQWYSQVAVKITPENIPATIRYLQEITGKFAPEMPFEYQFLDDDINNLYHSERQIGRIFNYFSFLAIVISCLGLFGLASFTAEQRTKEIGIRKILGASVSNIIILQSLDFIKWVILANVVAFPFAYFVMHEWLQNFAYKTKIGFEVFILSGLFALIIAMMTVGYHAVKTANSNPVDALKYE